ncbi:beta-1,6-N-acetylglucosaminyltransferase [Sphingosinicellaceae bacterium]|nr:beta-1,6-N-acetylglucosaminyltransferase [Sphingosinicellaceae bacterium]
MKPKLAYFVMVHHKPAQFGWLLDAIDEPAADRGSDPGDLIMVHVDMKSRLGLKADRRGVMAEVRRLCAGRPNVRILPSRFTNWGGWSLSQMLLDAIASALKADGEWEYFINLSGQCYPLHPLPALKQALADGSDSVHVELLRIADLPADDWHHAASPMLELPLRAIRRSGRQAAPEGFAVDHKGSQWVMLPRSFCEWIVTSPLVPPITKYLRGRLLSDELIMQTLALNSPFRDRIAGHYGREIYWPGPRVLTRDDLPVLSHSTSLFARKFDAEVDEQVLRALAAANGFRSPPVAGVA